MKLTFWQVPNMLRQDLCLNLPSLVKITLDGADLVSSSPRARRTQKREDSAPVNDTKFENIRNTSVDNANQGGACGGCGLEALPMPSHS
jgi:hypothetical protein